MGIVIFDRIETPLQQNTAFVELMWQRRELENYFCTEDVLMAYAHGTPTEDLFEQAERPNRQQAMREAIEEVFSAH